MTLTLLMARHGPTVLMVSHGFVVHCLRHLIDVVREHGFSLWSAARTA